MQAFVDLKEIETNIKKKISEFLEKFKSVSTLSQNFVKVLNTHFTETQRKRKTDVCAKLCKFTFYGEPLFDVSTMKKIRLELRASTDKHKVSFPKNFSSLQKSHWGPFCQGNNYSSNKGNHSSNSSERKGVSNGK